MNIYIVGGGAAGMLLSILIKRKRPNINVVILEKNHSLGRKLLVTGNGRCNYTNAVIKKSNFHSGDIDKAWSIIENFDNEDAMELFETLGILPKIEGDNRVFPFSLEGRSFVKILESNIEKLGVTVIPETEITSIKYNEDIIEIWTEQNMFVSDKCIVATGGLAMPRSGSNGKGHSIAEKLGHKVIKGLPSIVQLHSDTPGIKKMSGVRIDTEAALFVDGKYVMTASGDVLFTDYGISGPAVLDLSREAVVALDKFSDVRIDVNLLGEEITVTRDILKAKAASIMNGDKYEFLLGVVHSRLINPIINILDQKLGNDWYQMEKTDIDSVVDLLVNLPVNITDSNGFDNAQTTSGGVDLEGLTDHLESKIVPGLYFIGEVVDVDGDCGGYNLQWAWSSSYAVAEDILNDKK